MDANAFVAADALDEMEGANDDDGWDVGVLLKENGDEAATAGVSFGAPGG